MSTNKNQLIDVYSFESVWTRIEENTDIKRQQDLAAVVGVKQNTVSTRKKQNVWPEEWAYRIGKKYDLLTEWILTGEGPKRISDIKSNSRYNFPILDDVNQWLGEVVVNEPYRREWFRASLEDAFPMFKEWNKRKKAEKGTNTDTPEDNVA